MAFANYILLDAARMDRNIEKAFLLNEKFECLFQGNAKESLQYVAPFLFSFDKDSEFGKWVINEGLGNSWGVFIQSYLPMLELLKLMRKLLIVDSENQEQFYFRFYDPRVFNIVLPTFGNEQLKYFFGEINYFLVESDKDMILNRFWLENYELHTSKIDLSRFDGREDILSLEFDRRNVSSTKKKISDKKISQSPTLKTVSKPDMSKKITNEKKGWSDFFFE